MRVRQGGENERVSERDNEGGRENEYGRERRTRVRETSMSVCVRESESE